MVVCIFEHVQWIWAVNHRLAHGYSHLVPYVVATVLQKVVNDKLELPRLCCEDMLHGRQTKESQYSVVLGAAWRFRVLPGPDCKPPCLAVKRPARPYKSAKETRFFMENAKGA